ncbi:hypothetical protein [Aquimarina agarivorans]|uniref:hypothetical protein n=1 Tax=Aquimarina agarivorans TaxID=980584 RepID=UPI000248E84B|nr:hypothetical protein [Aquimarina agarivorans]
MILFKNFFTNNLKVNMQQSVASNCPNCWGDQEYDGEIRVKYLDPQISVNNGKRNYTFIKKFVVTYLNGIKLKNSISNMECPTCVTSNKV